MVASAVLQSSRLNAYCRPDGGLFGPLHDKVARLMAHPITDSSSSSSSTQCLLPICIIHWCPLPIYEYMDACMDGWSFLLLPSDFIAIGGYFWLYSTAAGVILSCRNGPALPPSLLPLTWKACFTFKWTVYVSTSELALTLSLGIRNHSSLIKTLS